MRRMLSHAAVGLALAGALLSGTARADVKPHPLFTEGMVLQQAREVPVWGTADEGEKITVKIKTGDASQEATTTAKDGKWAVKFTNLPAADVAKNRELTTRSQNLFGETYPTATLQALGLQKATPAKKPTKKSSKGKKK